MRLSPILALFFTIVPVLAQSPNPAANDEFFETRIRPLFANNCYACHTDEHMGGLQLDTAEHALKGGKSGAVIVPGDPANSLMVKALHYDDARLKMPPTGRLKDSEIADVETWIKNGAVWPQSRRGRARPSFRPLHHHRRTARLLVFPAHCQSCAARRARTKLGPHRY